MNKIIVYFLAHKRLQGLYSQSILLSSAKRPCKLGFVGLNVLLFIGCLGTSIQAWSADCTPSYITISSQADVDNFQTLFGNGATCDRVTGNLIINNVFDAGNGTSLTNLDGLSHLTEIGGNLEINNNDAGSASNSSNSLMSLGGLAKLTTVGGHFELLNNSQLSQCRWIAKLLGWPEGQETAEGQQATSVNVGSYILVGSNSNGCNSLVEIYADATANASSLSIGPMYSGSWYYAEQSGHGFSLEVGEIGDNAPLVVLYWYTYDNNGFPVFLIGNGVPDENGVAIALQAHYGMIFGEFDSNTVQKPYAGVARFTFLDANNGLFEYSPSEWTIANFGHSNIVMPITKLFDVSHPDTEESSFVLEVEPNEQAEHATNFQLGGTVKGSLSNIEDVDWFAVEIDSQHTGMMDVNFDVSSMSSGLWSVDWYDPNMNIMSGRNLSAPEGFQYQFPAYTAGTYYLRIAIELDFLYNGGRYAVTLTEAL